MDNKEFKKSITAVITTLENIEIKATYDNLDKLLGCQQVLRTIIGNLAEENGSEENDGSTDSE